MKEECNNTEAQLKTVPIQDILQEPDKIKKKKEEWEDKLHNPKQDPEDSREQNLVKNLVKLHDKFKRKYEEEMEEMYTNWNAGLTKDGKSKTFDYTFDRKATVAYADVEKMIDDGLCTGNFEAIDELYNNVINGTCKHLGHSGPGGYPSKRDRCAVAKRVKDKQKTKESKKTWDNQKGRKSKKPKVVYKTVYKCKRRKPQEPRSKSGIYQDKHDKKLWQFSTASNDGFLNGCSPFAVLFNLHNCDDKAIVLSWVTKKPTIIYTQEGNQLVPKVRLHIDTDGEMAGEYCAKYALKPNQPRLSHSDTMLAAMANLQPENAVTTGTFARMYNKVSQIGPQPIFQCVHMNFNLPPVIKNLNVKDCSVLGISVVEKQSGGSKETENEEPMGIEYAMPSPLEKFNRRWDDKVQCPKNIKAEDYRQEMSVKEFCDRFNVNWRKGNDDSTCCLHLSERRDRTESMYYPIRMKPHLTERNANPNSPRYWLYCRHLCLWLIPCKTIADLMPESNLEEAELEVYWINKYDDILCKDDLALLSKWARV